MINFSDYLILITKQLLYIKINWPEDIVIEKHIIKPKKQQFIFSPNEWMIN